VSDGMASGGRDTGAVTRGGFVVGEEPPAAIRTGAREPWDRLRSPGSAAPTPTDSVEVDQRRGGPITGRRRGGEAAAGGSELLAGLPTRSAIAASPASPRPRVEAVPVPHPPSTLSTHASGRTRAR
jgi:hypothetical protein